MSAFVSASNANGLRRPLGELPALKACTSLPSFLAQWFSMPSLSTLRAELWVQRIRTLVVIGGRSAAGRRGFHRDADRLAALRRGGAAGRRRLGSRFSLLLAEHRDVGEGV